MPRPILHRVESAGGGNYNHPAGGFVCVITDVTEDTANEYLSIEYDIAEGEHAGHYEYSNEFRRYYSEPQNPSWGNALAKFLTVIEDENPGFSMDEWQKTWPLRDLKGKKFGAVFRERKYTDTKGNDRTRPQFVYACSCDSIRKGAFNVPEPIDARATIPSAAAPSEYAEDVPF